MDDTGSSDPEDLSVGVVGIHDSETGGYQSFLEAELPKLWPILERADMLVGYNSNHFDIPLLNKYYPGNLAHVKSLDLMQEVYAAIGRRLRLDAIAEGTLGEKKIADGMQSLRWWKAGEIEKVRAYCLKDVELTRRIFDYALEHGSIKYAEFGKIRDVKLKTSSWLSASAKPMTFSFGF